MTADHHNAACLFTAKSKTTTKACSTSTSAAHEEDDIALLKQALVDDGESNLPAAISTQDRGHADDISIPFNVYCPYFLLHCNVIMMAESAWLL